MADPQLRLEVEGLLYHEAALLDEWRLEEWLALFTPDCRYVIPTTDFPEAAPARDGVFVDDDWARLQGRVTRLKSRHAHREYPYSRTRHIVSNVRLTGTGADEITAEANFVVYRIRSGQVAPYIGHYEYTLTQTPGGLRIRHKRAVLDLETLRDHGAVSIIL